MNLLDYQVGGGIEARFATVPELQRAASSEGEPDVRRRLLTVARLREILEAKEQKVVEALIGRLGTSDLDDVSIVLEQTTQEIVESELADGSLCP